MEFSKKAREHIDSCRFCWMCHHICPIGNATGLERNTARARALGLSNVARDAIEYSDDIIDNVYECSLCGGCVADCTTGWDPVMFTKEARLGAALDGKLPSYVMTMLENLQAKGNIYGKDKNENIPEISGGDILFFLGEDVRANGCAKVAVELLKKAGVDFTLLRDEPISGYCLDFLLGASAETKAVMEECAKVLNGFKKVVCYDPCDAKVMKREYKEWGIALNAEVVTFTEFIAELIETQKLKVKNSSKEYTPQDNPCQARDLEETESIRKVLSSCGKIKEMNLCKKETMLAGNLIMNEYMPEVMEEVAKMRWTNAANMNAKAVVTQSCAEYVLLSKTKPEGMEILKIEEAVAECL